MKSNYKISLLLLFIAPMCVWAQHFEVGAWGGIANYFGDLNNTSSFKMVRPGGGIFLRNNFNPRWSLKSSISFAQVAFDDKKSPNDFNQRRNLHFRSNIGEIATMVEFNFLEFNKAKAKQRFSPYFSIGFSVFYYNPQAKYNDEWHYLKPLGTEGQTDESYSGVKKYHVVNFAIPIGGGLKFSINRNWNIGIDGGLRVTFTDYIDDVSGSYVSPLSLPEGSNGLAYILADRSGETGGEPIGIPGTQRGTSKKKDFYLFAGLTVSYTFIQIKCPKFD